MVPTIDDALDEPDQETFTLGVSFPGSTRHVRGRGHGPFLRFPPSRSCDNDDPPTLSVADVSAEEGDGLTFTVTLSAESGRDVTVDWEAAAAFAEVSDDSATSGTDYHGGFGDVDLHGRGRRLDYRRTRMMLSQSYIPGEMRSRRSRWRQTEDEDRRGRTRPSRWRSRTR